MAGRWGQSTAKLLADHHSQFAAILIQRRDSFFHLAIKSFYLVVDTTRAILFDPQADQQLQ